MLRWGILSTARIAQDWVIPGILDADNSVATAIASRDPERARLTAARFGIPLAFGSYEALLACPEVDAVYVPPNTRPGPSRPPRPASTCCAKSPSR